MSEFHELTVSKVRKLTPNAVSITFDIPEPLKATFSFIPGQYVTIRKILNDKELRRSYSICSPISEKAISVGVKKVKGGAFSVFANDSLKAGDTLEVMAPEGRFILNPDRNNKKNYLTIAAGSGITPVLSILSSSLEQEPSSKAYLIYGNQSEEEMMFREEIERLRSAYPDRFFVEYLFSRRREDYGLFGRIEKSTLNYILKSRFDTADFDAYYLCGPEAMIETITEVLQEKGVPDAAIRSELFSSSDASATEVMAEGMAEITITLDDETETFSMSKQSSILAAALDEGLEAPYSCQGGICSTCIARLVEGTAEMRKNQILTDDELEEGYILTCQAHPTSDKVVVDYDDV